MEAPKPNIKEWNEPSTYENAMPIGLVTPFGPLVFTPLMYAEGDNGEEVVACAMQESLVGPDRWSQELIIMVPGLCGHFSCGGVVRVSLN